MASTKIASAGGCKSHIDYILVRECNLKRFLMFLIQYSGVCNMVSGICETYS